MVDDRRDHPPVLGYDEVLELPQLSPVPLEHAVTQPAQGERPRAVEVQLAPLEEHERRQDPDLPAADGCRR